MHSMISILACDLTIDPVPVCLFHKSPVIKLSCAVQNAEITFNPFMYIPTAYRHIF